MFENIASKLQDTFYKLKNKGYITEKDLDSAFRDIRMTLLEADVNYKLVKEFIARLKEKCLGESVFVGLNAYQQIIKIVYDELTDLLGGKTEKIAVSPNPPTVIMMSGLQGAGKTTTCAKLAVMLRKEGKKPLMAAADVYRPAAIQQLHALGKQVNIPVFDIGDSKDAVEVAKHAVHKAKMDMYDTVILDVAGRLHIDEEMMQELKNIKANVAVSETLLVVDAMTGQDAVNVAKTFDEALNIDGIIMTKMDGDAKGGAALSIKQITGKPIKFVGTSEKMDGLELFHPDRMASRILGHGDVLTLIEQTQQTFDIEEAKKLEKKFRKDQFDLNDFLEQLRKIQKMGPLENILKLIPGMAEKVKGLEIDPGKVKRIEAIISSMTKEERSDPSILNGQRRRRIAKGSGTTVEEINILMHQFEQMKKMIKKITDTGSKKGKVRLPF
ncbi:MAG: signal recognition particle protein [Armatimonadetes bacterium]|nr:signal recognition particle protein [Candidatus Hippobium faecium]